MKKTKKKIGHFAKYIFAHIKKYTVRFPYLCCAQISSYSYLLKSSQIHPNPGARWNVSFTSHKRSVNCKQCVLILRFNRDASQEFQASQSSLTHVKIYLQKFKVSKCSFIYLQVITAYHDFDVTPGVWRDHIIGESRRLL